MVSVATLLYRGTVVVTTVLQLWARHVCFAALPGWTSLVARSRTRATIASATVQWPSMPATSSTARARTHLSSPAASVALGLSWGYVNMTEHTSLLSYHTVSSANRFSTRSDSWPVMFYVLNSVTTQPACHERAPAQRAKSATTGGGHGEERGSQGRARDVCAFCGLEPMSAHSRQRGAARRARCLGHACDKMCTLGPWGY